MSEIGGLLAQVEVSTKAKHIPRIRKLPRKDGLFRVWSPENQAVSYLVDLNAKTCTCPNFTQQGAKCKHIKVAENICEIRRQKGREYDRKYRRKRYQENREEIKKYNREYQRERYHSDPEFREKSLKKACEFRSKNHLKLQEDYKRFKIEYGGKCTVCGESNLDLVDPHHPHGKEEKGRGFAYTKEFRDWVRYGIKPDVVLMCVKCHRLRHLAERRREEVGPS